MTDSKKIILLAEDDKFLRSIFQKRLEEGGYTVCPASDGLEALDILDKTITDLVLLDIIIPKKDGIAVLRELKQAGKIPQLPVYILSALSDMEKVAEGIALGARGYFVKQESGREEIVKAVRALFAPQ